MKTLRLVLPGAIGLPLRFGNVGAMVRIVLQPVDRVFAVIPLVGNDLFDFTVRFRSVQMRLGGIHRVFKVSVSPQSP